jgi:hypothetical protein
MYDAIVVGALRRFTDGHAAGPAARSCCWTRPAERHALTHYIHSGRRRLKKWGLLDKVVASNCPPVPASSSTWSVRPGRHSATRRGSRMDMHPAASSTRSW